MRFLGLALALAAGMLVMWFLMGKRLEVLVEAPPGSVTVRPVQRHPLESGPAAPRPASSSRPAAAAVNPPRVSPLMAEMARARSYKPIHERLSAKPDRTPEESYALAEILTRCAKHYPVMGFQYQPRFGGDERRRQFVEALSSADPQRDKRIAAFDAINHDPCAELEGLDTKLADIRALIASAAAEGDPKARAVQLTQEVWDSNKGDGKGRRGGLTVSDAQLETLRSLMSTQDPEAVLTASRILQMSFENLAVRTGAEQASLDVAAFQQAARFVACDLGASCGPDAPDLAYACAANGLCAASDYRDYAYQYVLSAAAAHTVQAYYEQLQRARAGDWSYFTFHRGQPPRSALHNPVKK